MENVMQAYLDINPTYNNFYTKHNNLLDENYTPELLFSCVHNDSEIVLKHLNVLPSKCGYNYWIDAVYLYLLSNKNRISICRDIYPTIAKKYGKTAMSVERAMRLCFENVMYNISKKKETDFISDTFKESILYPHNSEILALIVELVSSKYFQDNKNKI